MTTATAPLAGHKAIHFTAGGEPYIQGLRCGDCGATSAETTMACPRCASRQPQEPFAVAATGRLFSWSTVNRSYPGVAVPFVSAIVDLDDGVTLKGTLRDVAPEDLAGGLPVRLVFAEIPGNAQSSQASYVGYHFVPQREGKQ